jgi:hypothetical protein
MAKESLSVGVPAAVPADADAQVTVAADVAAISELDREIIRLVFKDYENLENAWGDSQRIIKSRRNNAHQFYNKFTELLTYAAEVTGLYTPPFVLLLDPVYSDPVYYSAVKSVSTIINGNYVPIDTVKVDPGAFRVIARGDNSAQKLALSMIHALAHGAQHLAFLERERVALAAGGKVNPFNHKYHDEEFTFIMDTLGIRHSNPGAHINLSMPEPNTPIRKLIEILADRLLAMKEICPIFTRGRNDIKEKTEKTQAQVAAAERLAQVRKEKKEADMQAAAQKSTALCLQSLGFPDATSLPYKVVTCPHCEAQAVYFPGKVSATAGAPRCAYCGTEMTLEGPLPEPVA